MSFSLIRGNIRNQQRVSNTEYTYFLQSLLMDAEDEVAKIYNIPIIDCLAPFNDLDSCLPKYFFDSVHLRPIGANLVATKIFEHLRRME